MTEIEVVGTKLKSVILSFESHPILHLITTFPTPASTTQALSARPTTTSVHSSSFTTTPMSSKPSEYTVSCMHVLYTYMQCTQVDSQTANISISIIQFHYFSAHSTQFRILLISSPPREVSPASMHYRGCTQALSVLQHLVMS